ncbi:MAG TPA: class A beta-lactamase-related serine hydrolase [Sporosarcina psychrophila]|uniref:Class A beta-lactamase-related serine hydrolase n=1 Tax=Sporosarcina psychrophila TaxID=1476 RepID=A0A921FYX0_SPOPS|nr:class A beta-lactamase-related serine hydrolase [Sporosarcina psychrophila]
MKNLSTIIQDLIENTTGTWGIVLEDLDLHDKWIWNGDEVFYAASVIKVPIMAAVFSAIQRESMKLSDQILLEKEDFVGGSGVLQHLTPGTSLTLYDLITLMIIQSDNTATNILIDLIGVEDIQQTMREAGMEKSTFYNKLMTQSIITKGINQVTALDMAKLLKEIVTGRMVSAYAGVQMIEIMKKQQIRDCLPEKLPSPYSALMNGEVRWDLANKTGWIPSVRHDVGIFYVGQRKLIASVLSKEVDDLQSKQILADIGLEIYNYLITNEK